MSQELARRADSMPIQNMDDLGRLAQMFAKSGYFKDARDAAQIGVKVLAGREMGFGPFASVNGVHVIEGKPSVGANLMAAAVKGSGRYDYRVRSMTDQECSLEFFEGGESLGVSAFSIEDAKQAGAQFTTNNGKPSAWGKFPRNMLFARAMSNGVRWYCPDVFMGSAVYTPEELGASVDEEGAPIDVGPVERTEPAAPEPGPEPAQEAVDPEDAEFPPEPDPPFQATGESITKDQLTDLGGLLTKAGMKPDDMRQFASWLIDRDIQSAGDLTQNEADRILTRFKDGRKKSGYSDDKVNDAIQEWADYRAMKAEEAA